jgi:osmotically-inducible protein OsmY
MEELVWDPRVGRAEIGVAARSGVVTISGEVDSYAQKIAAVKAAERVAGVRAVADDLRIEVPSSYMRSDMDIAHAVTNAMRWDIEVPHEKIQARVDEGWVWLDGEVDWEFQRAAATRALRNLTGVMGVTNEIRLKKHVFAPDVKGRIESALRRNAAVDAAQITVLAKDGEVTLKGHVHSWSARTDAERAAWSAPGVTRVKDELTV